MTEYEKPRILSVTAQHVAELERENAKLRELLIDLKCAPCCSDSCWLHLPERLRELGIEVDK
jgi:hypothetical protein